MKHRYLNRWRRVAVALWGVCCLLPGVLVALSGSPSAEVRVEKLSQLYGHEVGAYLGYCPSALLAYVLPLLALSPVVLLLATLGGDGLPAHRIRDAVRLAVAWGTLNACALLLVTMILVVRYGREGAVAGWAFSLWSSLLFSGLPSLGLSTLIAAWARSRRLALIAGLLAAGVFGFVAVYARAVGVLWLPGALDQSLFAGTNASLFRGATFACAWFALWLVLGNLPGHLRQRRPVATE